MSSLDDVLKRIPYLGVHGLSVAHHQGAVVVHMPLREPITNHVGIVHAGATYTAAETAAGVAAWGIVPGDKAYVLLRAAQVRYTRRAEGDVAATARVSDEGTRAARAAFAQAGRADATVEVNATDAQGETVFVGSFDYALRPRGGS
jgi:uncharacterized protein (TIGR00369 family)